MSLTTRVITWDFTDCGQDARRGSVTIAPSMVLTDPSDAVIITMSPRTWQYAGGVGSTVTGLITTDNAAIQQQGWWYVVSVQWGNLDAWTKAVFLPAGSGSIDLSSLAPLVAPAVMQSYLPTSGGALTGPLLLAADPVTALGAATKEYVDNHGGGGAVSSVFGRAGAVVAGSGDYAVGQVTGAAPLASPALSGTPTAPTASALTDNTQVATTAYADSAVAVETSRATTAEALKAPLASPALTGNPTAPTQSAADNSTKLATTAYVTGAVGTETTRAEAAEALLAPLASPALTGTPTAPTKTALTNNTDIATTAYADAAVAVETSRAQAAEGLAALKANNLSDLASASAAVSNLGLTSAQTSAIYAQRIFAV